MKKRTYLKKDAWTKRRSLALKMREEGTTYQEIADHLGVTRQRAHQIVNGNPKKVIPTQTLDAVPA